MSENIKKDTKLQKTLIDICRGFSVTSIDGVTIYIKHQTVEDSAEIDGLYENYLQDAKENGIWEESRRLEYLNKTELWTNDQEKELQNLIKNINRLTNARSKKTFKQEIEHYDKLIDKEWDKVTELSVKRDSLVGMTCESYARGKSNDTAVFNSVFLDPEFKTRVPIDELIDAEKIRKSYYQIIGEINIDTIKEIALLPAFSERFNLCNGDAFNFFGKPLFTLTHFQTELASYGSYFGKVFEKFEIPLEIQRNPNAVISHVQKINNLNKQTKHTKSSQDKHKKTAYLGATEEELRSLGFDTSSPEEDLMKKTGKKSIKLRDLLKITS